MQQHLEANYTTQSDAEMAAKFNTSVYLFSKKRGKFYKAKGLTGKQRNKWTNEMQAYLEANYRTSTIYEIAHHLGIGSTAVNVHRIKLFKKLNLKPMRITRRTCENKPPEKKQSIVRPPAVYSNCSPYGIWQPGLAARC